MPSASPPPALRSSLGGGDGQSHKRIRRKALMTSPMSWISVSPCKPLHRFTGRILGLCRKLHRGDSAHFQRVCESCCGRQTGKINLYFRFYRKLSVVKSSVGKVPAKILQVVSRGFKDVQVRKLRVLLQGPTLPVWGCCQRHRFKLQVP